MTTVTKVLRFAAGHRLLDHEGACAQLHGHNYRAEITVAAETGLDAVGRVVDFAVVKQEIGGWIDREWDHGFLVNRRDGAALAALREFAFRSGVAQRIAVLDGNPTAEVMARTLLEEASGLLRPHGVRVAGVVLWETDTCAAEVTVEPEGPA